MLQMRRLVRAMFDEQRPLLPQRKARVNAIQRAQSWDVNDTDDEPTYVPKAFEGEYNVSFQRKPLGVGLVPSSQLYGSWEVSSIQEAEPTDAPFEDKNQDDGTNVAKGDVLIAVNFSCRKAHLPRAKLAAYLRHCSCPIVMTLRNPQVCGSMDSHAMSTAMYPSSVDYDLQYYSTKVVARASSSQWQRSLVHDLVLNAQLANNDKVFKLVQKLMSKSEMDMKSQALVDRRGDAVGKKEREKSSYGHDFVEPILSELGEFEVTFDTMPLHFVLAPSTRLYGVVEIYDPKDYAPTIQVGDVVMVINEDRSPLQLSSDEVIDMIAELQAPVTLRFRRPVAYRKYLATYYRNQLKELSSASIASAMYPLTAEYKQKASKQFAKKAMRPKLLVSQSFMEPETTFSLSKTLTTAGTANEAQSNDFRAFARKIGDFDRFKLWKGNNSSHGGRPLAGHQSAFLTEKHMQFVRKHLPSYLMCNQMELFYSTRIHGWNFLSFFDRLENKGPTLLFVQDENDHIFGAFCPASWKQSKTFFGNGRAFVFSLNAQMRAHMWSGLDSSFMYTQQDAIFVGGGKKGIALCLQLDDRRGFTHACTTFESPPLVESQSFRCETVEVWGFYGLKV
ncbi:hypothetical protein CCR75_005361 [Bremia lactucae]|uniref:TLDc domain-containing protein n=1 Tax=Bremia lactucae TaxID=4779 RepID=A0A976FG81_BRELC|nr:hypothetical protein CCR75_005361 [Bremia lactucae]